MKTYVLLQFDSEGAPFSAVSELLVDLGFRAHSGGYDFVYDWGRDATVQESLGLADRVQASLRGQNVFFRLESSEG